MGEREAFTTFVERRQASLVRLAWALTGDRQLGEDLAQATLARLWSRWAKVSARGDPWPYTQRIAVSLASTWRRRRWRGEIATDDLPEPDPRDEVGATLSGVTVSRWLAALPRRQRAVIVLRFVADLPVDEAADVLGCSPGTVMSQTAKARHRLRALIEMDRESEEQLS